MGELPGGVAVEVDTLLGVSVGNGVSVGVAIWEGAGEGVAAPTFVEVGVDEGTPVAPIGDATTAV